MSSSLHLISTGKQSFTELTTIVTSIQEWFDYLHIREKHRSAAEIFAGLQQLADAGFPMKRIIINDRVDVAAATESFGVQLAHHSLPVPKVKQTFPSLKAGKSVHSLQEAIHAEQEGADFLIFGHLYPTSSKPGTPGRGVESLREITRHVGCPVIGIGGITPDRTRDVLHAGGQGIAVMSGILQAEDPLKAVQAYRMESYKGGYYE